MTPRGEPVVSLTPAPWVLASLCFCAGTLVGMRAARAFTVPQASFALAIAAAWLGYRLQQRWPAGMPAPRAWSRAGAALLLGALFAAGAASGRVESVGAHRDCLSRLVNGQEVEVAGRLATSVPALTAAPDPAPSPASSDGSPAPPASVRVALVDAELRAGANVCPAPRVLARVRRPPRGASAGAIARLRGRWSAYGRGEDWPRRPERRGQVRAAFVSIDETAGLPGLSPLERLRAAGIQRVESRLPPDVSPTAVAVLLAERGRLDPATSRTFADAGLAHLLAISGLHVGILAGAALSATGIFLVGSARYLLAALLVLGYVIMIGAPPAAVRASLLFCGYAASRARGSPARTTDLLALAAMLAVLADPLTLLEPGFQLSFAGFSGLLLGSRVVRRLLPAGRGPPSDARRWVRRSLRSFALAIGASAGAFALTAPIAAWHFHRTAPVSVVSSLVGSPVVALALLALAGVLALPGPAADTLAAAATVLLRALLALVESFADLPLGHLPVGRPGPVEWTIIVGLLLAALLFAAGRSVWRTAPCLGLAVSLAVGSPAIRAWRGAGQTLLCTLDVGQGDAAVLRTRRGHWLVVDAGSRFRTADAGRRVVVPFLLSRGARAIELVVLTHPDLDHVGGMKTLFERFPVHHVLDSGIPLAVAPYREYLASVSSEGASWLVGRPGSRLMIDEVEILVLGPDPATAPGSVESVRRGPIEANEASLSLRISIGDGFRYVNAGDAPDAEERRILDRWPPDTLRAHVLKVSHHGSKSSSGARWLETVAPELAIISAGAANRYGHPHARVLARLDSVGIGRLWRTDLEGTACVTVDSEGRWRVGGA